MPGQVDHFEEDHDRLVRGDTESVFFQAVTGLTKPAPAATAQLSSCDEREGTGSDDDSGSSSALGDSGGPEGSSRGASTSDRRAPGMPGFQVSSATEEERREHKRITKELNREKRKTKIPKHVKKRAGKVNKK